MTDNISRAAVEGDGGDNDDIPSDVLDASWAALFGENIVHTPQRKLLALACARLVMAERDRAIRALPPAPDVDGLRDALEAIKLRLHNRSRLEAHEVVILQRIRAVLSPAGGNHG